VPVHIRRSIPLGLSCVVALGLGASNALAAPPEPAPAPATTEPDEPLRFTFDLHGGALYRVGSVDATQASRGGGLLGLDVLLGPNKWWALGLGYDHAFIADDRVNATGGAFTDTTRTLDELWALGRVYPWQNDAAAFYLQLGLGPTWQTVSTSGDVSGTGLGGNVQLMPSQCSARSPAGLGLRGSAGFDVALTSMLIFFGEAGVDHYQLADQINGCGAGLGSSTFLATRFGFALATGRIKPPPPPAPPPPPSDRDGDAILDNVDACPDQAGLPSTDPTRNGCPPPPDRDHDGIPDAADACPDQAGPPSDDPKRNGCPDRDGDKIIDSLDACPDVAGVPSDDPKKNGCPPDTDGDGITDDKDACPKEPGPANADPTKNGCPMVMVREGEIVIGQQVQFEIDKSVIKKESDELLDGIAKVLKEHLEIARVEVQGHTDNTGKAQHNKVLSASRAEAVRRALVKRGIVDRRLVAKGFGQEKPLGENDTDAGRARNRRVQFVILEKKAPSDAPSIEKAPPPKKK